MVIAARYSLLPYSYSKLSAVKQPAALLSVSCLYYNHPSNPISNPKENKQWQI
jgi:hypothetical protein